MATVGQGSALSASEADYDRRPLHGMVTFRKLSALMRMPRYSGVQFTEGLGWRLLRQPKPKPRFRRVIEGSEHGKT